MMMMMMIAAAIATRLVFHHGSCRQTSLQSFAIFGLEFLKSRRGCFQEGAGAIFTHINRGHGVWIEFLVVLGSMGGADKSFDLV